MSRDDYYVVVYQILAYLYQQLKKGEQPDPEYLKSTSPLFGGINEGYWKYIMVHMYRQGYIEGLAVDDQIDNVTLIYRLENTQITPDGIDYLCNNSLFEKAKQFLKDAREMIPFM